MKAIYLSPPPHKYPLKFKLNCVSSGKRLINIYYIEICITLTLQFILKYYFKPLKPLVLIASKNNKTKKKTLSKNVKKKNVKIFLSLFYMKKCGI